MNPCAPHTSVDALSWDHTVDAGHGIATPGIFNTPKYDRDGITLRAVFQSTK